MKIKIEKEIDIEPEDLPEEFEEYFIQGLYMSFYAPSSVGFWHEFSDITKTFKLRDLVEKELERIVDGYDPEESLEAMNGMLKCFEDCVELTRKAIDEKKSKIDRQT